VPTAGHDAPEGGPLGRVRWRGAAAGSLSLPEPSLAAHLSRRIILTRPRNTSIPLEARRQRYSPFFFGIRRAVRPRVLSEAPAGLAVVRIAIAMPRRLVSRPDRAEHSPVPAPGRAFLFAPRPAPGRAGKVHSNQCKS